MQRAMNIARSSYASLGTKVVTAKLEGASANLALGWQDRCDELINSDIPPVTLMPPSIA